MNKGNLKMKNKINLMILIFMFVSCFCFAQEHFTLDQIRMYALSNSKVLSKLNLSIESSILDGKSLTYNNLPSLSIGASGGGEVWGGDTGLPDSINANASISLSQKIWDGGKNSVQIAINKISTEIARLEALREYYSILDSADSAYFTVLEAQASLAAAESLLKVSMFSLTIAEVRQSSGAISMGDYLQAVAENESKKTDLSLAKRDLALSIARIKSITGLTVTPVLEMIDFKNYEPVIQTLSILDDTKIDKIISTLQNIVYIRNPSVSSSNLSSKKADKAVDLASKDYFPNINFGASTGVNYNYLNDSEMSPGRLSISGSLPLNIWVTKNNIKNKKIAQEQALLDYQETERTIDIEIQSGVLNCIAQASSVISSRKALEYAEKQLENKMELYRLSSASLSDVSDATALVSSSQKQLIQSQFSFLLSISVIRSLGVFDSEQQVVELMVSE